MLSIERVLKRVVLPDLDQGRPDWDRPHTLAVVHWIKEICASETQLDSKVLVAAAYAHDWGYIGLFPEGADYDTIQTMKPLHMERGAKKIRELLESQLSSEFTAEQIERVVHLVFVHDRLDQLESEDEVALAEADTLGALDIERVKPSFNKADNEKYMKELMRKRWPVFKHAVAVQAYNDLLKKREGYYD